MIRTGSPFNGLKNEIDRQQSNQHQEGENNGLGEEILSSIQLEQQKLNHDENDWTIVPTQRNAERLVCNGYSYVVDKRQQSSTNWKCDTKGCKVLQIAIGLILYTISKKIINNFWNVKGRATSKVDGPPVKLTKAHNHSSNPRLKEELLKKLETRLSRNLLMTANTMVTSQDSCDDSFEELPAPINNINIVVVSDPKCTENEPIEHEINQEVISQNNLTNNSNTQRLLEVDESTNISNSSSNGDLENVEYCSTENEQMWYLTASNKQSQGGFKVYSDGYCYTVDKPSIKEIRDGNFRCIYWKCESVGCRGRAISAGLYPPLEKTVAHNTHEADPNKLDKLKMRDDVRKAVSSGASNSDADSNPLKRNTRFILKARNKRFRTEDQINHYHESDNLINELVESSSNEADTVKQSVEMWSESQVNEWFVANEIDQRLTRDLTPCSGIVLRELYEMRRDAPESFFQTFNSSKEIKLLPALLKFTHCLKNLFN